MAVRAPRNDAPSVNDSRSVEMKVLPYLLVMVVVVAGYAVVRLVSRAA